MADIDAEILIRAAAIHGANSEPDHKIGELQDYFRSAFSLLTPEQKAVFLAHPDVLNATDSACPDAFNVTESPAEAYAKLAGAVAEQAPATPGTR